MLICDAHHKVSCYSCQSRSEARRRASNGTMTVTKRETIEKRFSCVNSVRCTVCVCASVVENLGDEVLSCRDPVAIMFKSVLYGSVNLMIDAANTSVGEHSA
jgi:hypothetical protein